MPHQSVFFESSDHSGGSCDRFKKKNQQNGFPYLLEYRWRDRNKNLEEVERIGIEAWRGIVIRLMDKFERVEQYCSNGELAIKSEGMEDTFKDIAVYSTLAMILFRKSENLKELQGKKWTPVDDKYNGDESFTHPMIAMREVAEKQQEEEEARKKAMDILEYEETEYWKKKAREN